MFVFHPAGNAKARALVSKIARKLCKCCFEKTDVKPIEQEPTKAVLIGAK
jgi:hypothetical protein